MGWDLRKKGRWVRAWLMSATMASARAFAAGLAWDTMASARIIMSKLAWPSVVLRRVFLSFPYASMALNTCWMRSSVLISGCFL